NRDAVGFTTGAARVFGVTFKKPVRDGPAPCPLACRRRPDRIRLKFKAFHGSRSQSRNPGGAQESHRKGSAGPECRANLCARTPSPGEPWRLRVECSVAAHQDPEKKPARAGAGAFELDP